MNFGCLYPRYIYNKYLHKQVAIPCGKCSACTGLKANLWSTRLELESKSFPYTLFFTLTYDDEHVHRVDVRDIVSDSPTWSRSLAESDSFLRKHDYLIPTYSVRDFQLFFKLLRSRLYRDLKIPENERILRYFVSFEYGPTTFYPHAHGLLWFKSKAIAQVIKKYIHDCWPHSLAHSSLSYFLERNRCGFVVKSAASYVAGYLNCSAQLPPILLEYPFRVKHLQSTCPPIGCLYFAETQIREFLFGNATKLTFKRPTNHRVVVCSLWRNLENRFFPRCPLFSQISFADRLALYTISSLPSGEPNYEKFKNWILSEWDSSSPLISLVRRVIEKDETVDVLEESHLLCLKRLFYLSRRFRETRRYFGLSALEYLSSIERYYQRVGYDKLCSQLRFEEEVSNSSNIPYLSIKYLPFLIDSGFYENKNSLSPQVYSLYLVQFGLKDDDHLCDYVNSSFTWQSAKALFDAIRFENTKTRRKKDFLANHPDYLEMYRDIYFRSFI